MDQQQHMTKTEAHPYHQGRGIQVFDPNCPLCREGPKDTTYIGWSLHAQSIRELTDAIKNHLDCRPATYTSSRPTLQETFDRYREYLVRAGALHR